MPSGSVYSIPREILVKAMEYETRGQTIYKCNYYSVLSLDEEYGLTMDVFAIAYKKSWKKAQVKLAFSVQEKRWRINSDLYFTTMGGWNMIWEKKKRSTCYSWYYYYDSCDPMDELYEREYDKHSNPPNTYIEHLWNYYDLVKLIPEAKYLTEFPANEIVKFISIWREHPQIEVIYKNPKTRNLWTDTRLWGLSKAKQKEVLPLLLKGYSLNNALGMVKYKSVERMEKAREKQRIIRLVDKEVKPNKWTRKGRIFYHLTNKEKYEIYKYVNENNIEYCDYADYLSCCFELKRNLKSHGVMFPKDFDIRHDAVVELCKLLEAKKEAMETTKRNKAYIRAVEKLQEKLSGIDIDTGSFKLVIPKDLLELKDVGDKMEICVGTCGYDQKVVNHESIILVFYRKDMPIECCELGVGYKELSLKQLRGRKNRDSKYHDKCLKIINDYIPLAQSKMWGNGINA